MFDPPLITSDKTHYLLRLPMNDPDSGAFRQIAMITINVSKMTSEKEEEIERSNIRECKGERGKRWAQ